MPVESRDRHHHVRREVVFALGRNAELKADESAETVVVIGGSAKILGHCKECVTIGGDINVEGEVEHSTVAVLGGIRVGPEGRLGRDIVAVGGKFEADPGAMIDGRVQEVDLGAFGLPHLEWLKQWFRECVLKLRPLSPRVGWVWVVTGGFFLLYFLVAVAFSKSVQACVGELTARPATTLFVGLTTKVLAPIILVTLAMTGVGLLVVPLLLAALFFGGIVGHVALLEYIGGGIGRSFGLDSAKAPLLAFLAGGVLVLALYMVPVVGFITFAVLGIWGLGAATTALRVGMRAERRQRRARFAEPPSGSGSSVPVESSAAATASGTAAAQEQTNANASASTATPMEPVRAAVLTAAPVAGFWERMGAALLDLALLCVVGAMTARIIGPLILLVALAYFAGMWAWKGTTIGGIVLKLKVERYDGGPVSFLVALVRALAAAFSAVVLFLGFFWIGWDPEKQGWHDKIAGTVVVRVPRSTPLVCV
jgi:uncharacterized RDD family membrane protein YckC